MHWSNNDMKIGTHNGSFQADNVFACAALIILFHDENRHGVQRSVEIVRTRDPEALSTCEFVVDVGGEYNHEERRYDHHQEGRAGERENGVLYSAFGLVWRHFGTDVVKKLLGHTYDDAFREAVAEEVDRQLVQNIDALDNGQDLLEEGAMWAVYNSSGPVNGYSLSAAIHSLNPSWHEDYLNYDEEFQSAITLAQTFLRRAVAEAEGTVSAQDGVREAVRTAEDPRIIVLDRPSVPWDKVLLAEDPNDGSTLAPEALYVVFPYEAGGWMCQCVPDALGSFGKRKALPEAWAGKRDEEFQQLTDVSDGIFCYPFVCGAQSKKSAIRLAKMAVQA